MADDQIKVDILTDTKSSVSNIVKYTAAIGGAYLAVSKVISATKIYAKAASDAEEITGKYNAVFKNMGSEASRAAKSLADNYGLAESTAKKLLSTTGDLLTGFGFSQTAALSLSEQVNSLAADLASFTNFEGGAEGAGMALTKAMLGETESAKSLGIVINQNNERYKELVKYYIEVEGKTEQQAKAYTALTIATEQSKNAIGDYARTSDSSANVIKRFGEVQKELNEELGKMALEVGIPVLDFLSRYTNGLKNVLKEETTWRRFVNDKLDSSGLEELNKQIEIATKRIKFLEKIPGLKADADSYKQLTDLQTKLYDLEKKRTALRRSEESQQAGAIYYDKVEKEKAAAEKIQEIKNQDLENNRKLQELYILDQENYYAEMAQKDIDYVAAGKALQDQEEVDAIEHFKNLTSYYEGYTSKVTDAFGALGERMGESIVEQESMWDATGIIVRDAIAGIIRAMGSEALVESAKNFAKGFASLANPFTASLAGGYFAAGAKWAAVGTLASAAAGAVTAKFAQGGEFTTSGPQMIMVGDNATGRERVKVDPLGASGGESRQPIHVMVNLDGKTLFDAVSRASNDGRVIINARSVR